MRPPPSDMLLPTVHGNNEMDKNNIQQNQSSKSLFFVDIIF